MSELIPPSLEGTEPSPPDARELRVLLQHYWSISDPRIRAKVLHAVKDIDAAPDPE